MNSTSKNGFGWRRALTGVVASGALAGGMLISAPAAQADIVDQIGLKYMQGAGGGQVSTLIEDVVRLRSLGYRPSKGNLDALQAGWDFLPNQAKLVAALQQTEAYQRKVMAQSAMTAPGTGPSTKAEPWVPTPNDDGNPFLGPEYDINPYD
jgi:heme oxygenase